jgi:PEP-CTERM/exosortase A-associated glycosyltransferase
MHSVLHVLDHSLPEQDGYSFRSHSILRQLGQSGLAVSAVTGPKQGEMLREVGKIDEIQYVRTPIAEGVDTGGIGGQLRTIRLTRKSVACFARQHRIDVIHAHSPCLNGLAALGLGYPLLYEMRSSWEDAAVSVGSTQEGSIRYRLSRALETFVVKRANAIVVICEGLKSELVDRGVSAEKITVVPNALSEDLFDAPPSERVVDVKRRHALADTRIIGFFGSFFEWEGIDCLIRAMTIVLESVPDARLLIAGGGRQERDLHELVATLGLKDSIVFAGRVPHDDISAYYVAADVMAYPRLPDRLTDMVTPLKPLEAMAQSTPVVLSDVGGHRELVVDGVTGTLFKAGSHEDLAQKLLAVLSDQDYSDRTTARALEYVRRERRWSEVADRYLPVYQRISDRQGT